MENATETYNNSDKSNDPNATSHYLLITVAVVIGMVGVMLRFAGSWAYLSTVSNVILVAGVIVGLKAIYNILK